MNLLARTAAVFLLTVSASAPAQRSIQSPPMGWNSWDAYGLTITEAQFRANVSVLKTKLLPFGWRYAVIDEGWFFENPEARSTPEKLHYAIDPYGRYVPVPARFPSAKPAPGPLYADSGTGAVPLYKLPATIEDTSFAELGRWVHAQGLQFGIHIVRGIPRASVERNLPVEGSAFHAQDLADQTDACPWDPTNWGIKNNAAGQAWYDSLLRQYAAWGVDLLKVDCIADHPYKEDEIRMIRRAIDKTGRPMVLSLSPGPTALEHAPAVSELATMWRISEDVWDVWDSKPGVTFPQSLKGQFARAQAWSELDIAPGHWPDLDMLPLGELRPSPGWGDPRHTRLTPGEQRTLLTLWAMKQSPLILGANLTLLDDATLRLLTNRDLLRIDQQGEGGGHIQLDDHSDLRVWAARVRKSGAEKTVIALFNLGDTPLHVDRSVKDLYLVRAAEPAVADVFNVWTGQPLGRIHRVQATLPPHGCLLLMVR
jgi:alpha-galactosidase